MNDISNAGIRGGCVEPKVVRQFGLLATVKMPWDDPLVAKPVEQPEGLGADILVIEVRKLIAKEKDASVRKCAIFIGVNLVPPT
jgi:hypothetical protein